MCADPENAEYPYGQSILTDSLVSGKVLVMVTIWGTVLHLHQEV